MPQNVRLVKETIESALKNVQPQYQPTIILHSDQGNVFKSSILRRFLMDTPITQSMSAKATPVDNAVIESFFASLKKECLYINDFASHEDIILAVIDFIYYYNHLRPHHFNGAHRPKKEAYWRNPFISTIFIVYLKNGNQSDFLIILFPPARLDPRVSRYII